MCFIRMTNFTTYHNVIVFQIFAYTIYILLFHYVKKFIFITDLLMLILFINLNFEIPQNKIVFKCTIFSLLLESVRLTHFFSLFFQSIFSTNTAESGY